MGPVFTFIPVEVCDLLGDGGELVNRFTGRLRNTVGLLCTLSYIVKYKVQVLESSSNVNVVRHCIKNDKA